MKILIALPKLEQTIRQLENELYNNNSIDIVIFPEGYLNENVEEACRLAKRYNTLLIGGHRRLNEDQKIEPLLLTVQGRLF